MATKFHAITFMSEPHRVIKLLTLTQTHIVIKMLTTIREDERKANTHSR